MSQNKDEPIPTELGVLQFANPMAAEYMKVLGSKLVATGCGHTIVGPYVTLRWEMAKVALFKSLW